MEINFLKYLPSSKKPLKKRKKVSQADRIKTWKLDYSYFDGTREQGYGGYKYDGRWRPLAKAIIKHYNLNDRSKILEIGCAKGYLIKEFKDLLPKNTCMSFTCSIHIHFVYFLLVPAKQLVLVDLN